MKVNESTEFKLNLKTIVSIIILTSSFMGMYYTLQDDIAEAKEMPQAVIDRIEYDLKQEWHTNHINKLEEEVKELRDWCRQIDKEIHDDNKKR
jgi:hypothetical protein|tara:strand:+ start:1985 stop:2263 length:279 start_codon:yes stop_codon:yes gene_type:complete